MKLDYETLIEIEDYIEQLNEDVGLSSDTIDDIRKAIIKYKRKNKILQVERETDSTNKGVKEVCGNEINPLNRIEQEKIN
jgi:hypothetical protein